MKTQSPLYRYRRENFTRVFFLPTVWSAALFRYLRLDCGLSVLTVVLTVAVTAIRPRAAGSAER
ncbi:hypothetical protein KCP74_03375 [Salmonella enterica subsp. enterica]|nr:hypothetical protein KCP74_03375 [Salmonella enterica subsp. enterica]